MRTARDTNVERLISISSEPLAPRPENRPTVLDQFTLGSELFKLLEKKNGFYAFESALHVFPLTGQPSSDLSLEDWNSESLWRSEYGDLAKGLLFFAEDALQNQFCLSSKGIVHFLSETGQHSDFADSIENWAERILSNYELHTRWPMLRQWQEVHGALTPRKRLMPKIPFFLGGRHDLDNLWAGDAVEGMRLKADIALQTRDLPDGAEVRLIVGERPKEQ